MKKVMIYIHGKGGNYREAEQYKQNCPDYDIYGVDYTDDFPWIVQEKILAVYHRLNEKYDYIYVLANSIGAYFSMHTLQKANIKKAFFISPILDMERLILDMMRWAEVSEEELSKKGEFPTDFGETLSWNYLCYVREHPISWRAPTEILYGENDSMTTFQTVKEFIDSHDSHLTIMEGGEHWFHTEAQLDFLNQWMRNVV